MTTSQPWPTGRHASDTVPPTPYYPPQYLTHLRPDQQVPQQWIPTGGYPTPPPQPPKKRRKWPFIVGGIVLVLVVIGAVSVAASGAQPTGAQPAAALTPEAAFLADVLDTPGLTSTMSDAEMIRLGRGACDVMAYQSYSRDDLVAQIGTTKLGPTVGAVLVDAAHRNLCPQYTFPAVSTALPATGSTAIPAAPPASPGSGPTTNPSSPPSEYPRKVALKDVDDQYAHWLGSERGEKFAVQLAPGVYAEMPPDGSVGTAADYSSYVGSCTSIKRYSAQHPGGSTCW